MLFAAASHDALAEWKHLGTSEGGAEIYVGRATFRKSSKATDWRPVSAASVAETLWKMACGKK